MNTAGYPWRRRRLELFPVEAAPLSGLQKQMNNLFDGFLTGFGLEPFGSGADKLGAFMPKLNVYEDAQGLTVTAELPGLDQKDVEVSLAQDTLTLRGEKRVEHEDRKENGRFYAERSYGSFERVIPLGFEANEDAVDASFKNGVLTIKVPKSAREQSTTKKVPIKCS